MRRRPELMQFEIGISTIRYFPASGTAGFERCCVSGKSRVPAPPPMMTESVFSAIEEMLGVLMAEVVERHLKGDPKDLSLLKRWKATRPPFWPGHGLDAYSSRIFRRVFARDIDLRITP